MTEMSETNHPVRRVDKEEGLQKVKDKVQPASFEDELYFGLDGDEVSALRRGVYGLDLADSVRKRLSEMDADEVERARKHIQQLEDSAGECLSEMDVDDVESARELVREFDEAEAERERQHVAGSLDNGEGRLLIKPPLSPGYGFRVHEYADFYHWVRIINDDNPKKPVICTLMLGFDRPGPKRSYWDFVREIFAVYARKGCPPNPFDEVPGMHSYIYRGGHRIDGPYFKNTFPVLEDRVDHYLLLAKFRSHCFSKEEWDRWQSRPGANRRFEKAGQKARSRKSRRPVGVRLEGNSCRVAYEFEGDSGVWVFSHLRVGGTLLADTLVQLRRNGMQRIPLSMLRRAIQLQAGKGDYSHTHPW